jgi:hypothetical protein
MVSPFPGMDPYLEHPAFWRDFHLEFLTNLRAQLNERLPTPYNAVVEETVRLVERDPPALRDTVPDVAIERGPGQTRTPSLQAGVAVLEPVTLPLPELEEVRDHWLELRHDRGRDLVTIIELLSPTNKSHEREMYKAKRQAILRQSVHLVELDLLLGGKRLPMRRPLPDGNYFAFVSRVAERPNADV